LVELVYNASWTLLRLHLVTDPVCDFHRQDFEAWSGEEGVWFGNLRVKSLPFLNGSFSFLKPRPSVYTGEVRDVKWLE